MSARWDAGWQPYARAGKPDQRVQCYFCGEASAIISDGDNPEDSGRVEVYCLNSQCDAREVTALVLRDAHGAGLRADVRALERIDETPALRRDPADSWRPINVGAWLDELDDPDRHRNMVGRRTSRAPLPEVGDPP
ncbi:hypothetical protein ACIBSS_17580 [Micromonospora aurantiaca]|uniref:hypothetical protein n=1 Tax=Micromonospora aurantiaca (nom. illeg.) TaxID=47850 RepID=UPI0037941198